MILNNKTYGNLLGNIIVNVNNNQFKILDASNELIDSEIFNKAIEKNYLDIDNLYSHFVNYHKANNELFSQSIIEKKPTDAETLVVTMTAFDNNNISHKTYSLALSKINSKH